MKKLFSILLTLAVVMSAFCTTAFAADAENDVVLWCRDGDVNDGQVVVTETTGSYQLVSTGKSGNGYELYTNTAKTNATRIVGMTATDTLLSTHTYYVVEADVKFGSNGDSFQLCVGGNKSGNISKEILSTNANINVDGWNSIKAVVEYASDDAANTSVYINGVLDHTTRSALRKSLIADYNVFRFVADAKDYTSSAAVATVDNIKIHLTNNAQDTAVWSADGDEELTVTASTGSYTVVDDAYQITVNTANTNNPRIVALTATDEVFSARKYYVIEADVRFESNGASYMLYAGNGQITNEISADNANIKAGTFNKITSVTEYAKDGVNTSVYVNGVFDHSRQSALRQSNISSYNSIRFTFIPAEYTSTAAVATVDNLSISLTDVMPDYELYAANGDDDITLRVGTASSADGSDGAGYELYAVSGKTTGPCIDAATATDDLFATRTYYVIEADVKFGANGTGFKVVTDKGLAISDEITSGNARINYNDWNRITIVVEYAGSTNNASVYVNGALDHQRTAALRQSNISSYTLIRPLFYFADDTSAEPVATIDNVRVYLTNYAPTATSLIAVEDNNTIEFRAQGIRGFNQIFATAYDASGNMDGKVYIDDDGAVAVIKREAASVYTGFVWNNTSKLTPICTPKDYQAQ